MKHTYHKLLHLAIAALSLIAVACSGPSVPNDAKKVNQTPDIFPDYCGVTIPANLCPTNFMLPDCDELVARLSCDGVSYTYGQDNKVIIDEAEWQQLRDAAKGSTKGINVEVFARKDGQWLSYKPFPIYVAKDTIDPYISYRLIQPSYITYSGLSIVQRNVTSFEESDIYNNQKVLYNGRGQCINCHAYKNYGTDNMLFHIRQFKGGTMIVSKGELKKVDLKTDSTISAGVYPAWHPTANLIAFSTNTTRQNFYTKDVRKVEVYDKESDLILYDVEKNLVTSITSTKDEMECFPTWSADGKTLYYTSVKPGYDEALSSGSTVEEALTNMRYNIYSRSFDIATHQFGEPQLVFDAKAMGKSATLPRVSPDGRYLTFSLGNYGCFQVWHPEADICIIDLQQTTDGGACQIIDTRALNSSQSESYPSFSSNGRWVMTASRRDDGNYTRPYVSYFDANGKCHKAFAIPQKDPEHNILLLRSYNRPEFMKQKVAITTNQFAAKAKEDAVKAGYNGKK